MNRRLAPVVAVMLSVAGCGGNATPTAPTTTSSAVSPAGSWSGSISDAISGDGTMQLSLSDRAPDSLTGTWSATFKNGDNFSGPAVAVLDSNGYGIIVYVQPPPPCATGSGPSALLGYGLVRHGVTSSQLTAQAGRISCLGPSVTFGSVNLSKQ